MVIISDLVLIATFLLYLFMYKKNTHYYQLDNSVEFCKAFKPIWTLILHFKFWIRLCIFLMLVSSQFRFKVWSFHTAGKQLIPGIFINSLSAGPLKLGPQCPCLKSLKESFTNCPDRKVLKMDTFDYWLNAETFILHN